MRRVTFAMGSRLALLATACGPVLDWREVAIDASDLVALFACKLQQATREVFIGPDQVEMTLRSGDADGVKFAVGRVGLAASGHSAAMLTQWSDAGGYRRRTVV